MIRSLTELLDEWMPIVAGSEINDDPFAPVSRHARDLLAAEGDEMPISWVHRDDRFGEKLATPDTSIADLIGEVDPIKVAEGRYLSDELTLHYGLVPRTNRGIFAINELPDLAPRIQVGLFNALEERDVQIRGFPIRLSLDLCMAFTANPEDYTNRGRIVTPLKDRIGSVIRTHYPARTDDAIRITRGSAWLSRETPGVKIDMPAYMMEIIEESVRIARKSPHVNQQSGVSVRASIAASELVVSNAERRCLRHGEALIVPRVGDLQHVSAGCRGKLELMLAEDERSEDKLLGAIVGEAVKTVFEQFGQIGELESLVDAFKDKCTSVEIGDEFPTAHVAQAIEKLAPLKKAAVKLCVKLDQSFEEPAYLVAAGELILEALYVNDRLSKYAYQGRTRFTR
jgi:magnesium chelatase subunit I